MSKVRQWANQIRYAYQRIRYGVSVQDSWSLDTYVAGVIARGMEHSDRAGYIDRSAYQEDWDLVKEYFTLRSREWETPTDPRKLMVMHDDAMAAFGRIYSRMWW